jgi:hypothetical protein
MPNTIIIRETFPTRDDAEGARNRLEHGGFSRHTIALVPVGDHFELAIHTRPEHSQEVRACIEGSDFMIQARRYVREYAPSAGQSLLLVWAMAATAVAFGYALSRNRDQWLHNKGNIDRRWDRADRLADTRYEDGWRVGHGRNVGSTRMADNLRDATGTSSTAVE